MRHTVVIGAGVSGLACAREIAASGADVLVLDKARGVGGRCATRRMQWQGATVRFDHGLPFYPVNDADFRALLHRAGAVVDGWPARNVGDGPVCQPDALLPVFRRLALLDGASALPKHLADGLEVRLSTRATSLRPVDGGVEVGLEDGSTVAARRVVVALPVEQARAFAADIPLAEAVLGFFASRPCLVVMGLWPGAGDLGWEVIRPGGDVAHVADESTKRPGAPPGTRALVIHASSRFSAEHLEEPPETWLPLLLGACVPATGDWIRTPLVHETHRWRYARVDPGTGLAGPLVTRLGDGVVGWCGEAFDPAGGVAGAWRSGVALAAALASTAAADPRAGTPAPPRSP